MSEKNLNITQDTRLWVCVSKGQFVGVDQSSGGYPWRPSGLYDVDFWHSLIEAEDYCRHWNKGDGEDHYGFGDMKPMEFHFNVTDSPSQHSSHHPWDQPAVEYCNCYRCTAPRSVTQCPKCGTGKYDPSKD